MDTQEVSVACTRAAVRWLKKAPEHHHADRHRKAWTSAKILSTAEDACVVSVSRAGCRFSSKTSYTFTLILQRAKVSKYHQSIKIRFSTQNIKISAVSTPIFARISPFFCIFRDLPEYTGENASKCQKMQKSFAPNFGNFEKISKKRSYFDTLAVFCTSVLCWIFAFSL